MVKLHITQAQLKYHVYICNWHRVHQLASQEGPESTDINWEQAQH